MTTAGLTFIETLRRWLAAGTSGGIEWQDGKRRRVVFVQGDQLLLVQSNLRSEGAERLQEQGPVEDIVAAVRKARLGAILREREGAIVVHPGIEPPSREPVALALALWEVVDALPALEADSWPKAVPTAFPRLAALPWDASLVNYLAELDGSRPTEDVQDFGPGTGEELGRALALARVMGAIEVGKDPSIQFQVVSQGIRENRPSGLFEGSAPLAEIPEEPAPPVPTAAPVAAPVEDLAARINAATSHFEVLAVQWQDPPEVMRKSYMALAAALHPDRWATSPPEVQQEMERLFDKGREAWATLNDPKRRDAYTRKVIFGELTEEEKAEQQLQLILEGERHLTNGQRDIAAQRYVQAHETLKKALAADPQHPQIRAYAAYCLVRLNQGKPVTPPVEEATAEVEAIASEIAGADWAKLLLGRTRLARGDEAGAQRAFIGALKLNPSNPDALAELKKLKGAQKAEPEKKGFFSRFFKK